MTVESGERSATRRSERRERGDEGRSRSSEGRERSDGESRGPRRVWLDWEVGSTSLRGWKWGALVWALGTWAVALALGIVAMTLVGGDVGRSLAGIAFAVIAASVATVFLLRQPPRGLFRLRFVDVVFGLVVGALLPFVAGLIPGAFGADVGWPALGAISVRWLALGVAAPLATALLVQLFANAFLLVSAFSIARRRGLSRVWAQVAAGAVAALSAAVPAVVFAGDVAHQPVALPIALAVVSAAWVVVTGRFWGALLLALTFQTLWVGLSVIGGVLA